MNTSAILLMVATQVMVAGFTAYFFWRVLKTPPRPEPDSYEDNDDDPR